MGTVNLGQVAALIKSVEVEVLPCGATPTVRNAGTKANAELVFGIPDTRNMIINILKNGYIQWPGMPSPLEDTSLHFEGYSWYEVSYRGNFFRAKGDNAKAFSSKRLTKEQIKNGTYVFQDDEQGDAIQKIYGALGVKNGQKKIDGYVGFLGQVNSSEGLNASSEGAFIRDWTTPRALSASYNADSINFGPVYFDSSYSVPTAEENRPRNLTFVIWALVKDE